MPRLLAGCELKGAAWLYPAVWCSSRQTLPLWPQTGSENGMRHSLIRFSGGWEGYLNAGGGKNHCLFSPWTASVILCSCIIFVMPRSPLWNNMLLRLACFQTSYLLKLESLRWGRKIRRLLQPGVGQPIMKNSILLSSKVGDHCRHHHNQQLDSEGLVCG